LLSFFPSSINQSVYSHISCLATSHHCPRALSPVNQFQQHRNKSQQTPFVSRIQPKPASSPPTNVYGTANPRHYQPSHWLPNTSHNRAANQQCLPTDPTAATMPRTRVPTHLVPPHLPQVCCLRGLNTLDMILTHIQPTLLHHQEASTRTLATRHGATDTASHLSFTTAVAS